MDANVQLQAPTAFPLREGENYRPFPPHQCVRLVLVVAVVVVVMVVVVVVAAAAAAIGAAGG
jgi:hypothetical protein